MKKRIYGGLLATMAILLLTACAKPIMQPLRYNKPIDFHIKKNAALLWEFGRQYSGTIPSNNSYNDNGLIGAVVSSAIDSVDRTNNPSRYMLTYGKAEQAIFMTSFRDVLRQNDVFKDVELVSDAKSVSPSDVMIDVFFKTARVSSAMRDFRITLTVDLTITTQGKPPFKRTYLVQSSPDGTSFVDQQHLVSTRLLEKLIGGLEEWHHSRK